MILILSLITTLLKSLFFFTGSYSNTVFLDPLSKEEEEICIAKMLKGDINARNSLIEHNLRLVAHIVKKFDTKNSFTDDLISIGTIGLIKGIDSYSENKQTRITTYAARCIENEILMYFRSNKKLSHNVSLDDSIGYDKEGNSVALIDILKDNSLDLNDQIYLQDNISDLKKYLKKLTPREQEIINKRYGLDNTSEKTQKDIANELNISRSYVSRIEKRAITKILRSFLIKNKK